MSDAGKINKIVPEYAIPGGEVSVECEAFRTRSGGEHKAFLDGAQCRIVAASPRRVLVRLAESDVNGKSTLHLVSGQAESAPARITVGRLLTDAMHIVANPAVDPKDDSLVFTRSGTRGQQLSSTMYRLETDGYLDEMPVEIMNPTAIAFGPDGDLYVTNRAEGHACRIDRGEEAVV